MKIVENNKEPIVEINTPNTAITDFSHINGYDTRAEKAIRSNKLSVSMLSKLQFAIREMFKYIKRK